MSDHREDIRAERVLIARQRIVDAQNLLALGRSAEASARLEQALEQLHPPRDEADEEVVGE